MSTPGRPFSERMGLVRGVVQADEMNDALRNSIWNFVSWVIRRGWNSTLEGVHMITRGVLKLPMEDVRPEGMSPHDPEWPRVWLLNRVRKLRWFEMYDLLEFAVERAGHLSGGDIPRNLVVDAANSLLEREHSAFRFIGGELTRVIDPAEAAEVEVALSAAKRSGLDGVHEHITQALALFGKRPEPDYRNAIKEAISAVEATVKLIEGVRGGGLDKALDALSKRVEIHGALKAGLNSLYGFTSDASGIRHPLLEASNIGEEDARFMIVTCSAAVNWIIAKADKAGVLKKA